jgi:hypothetical protein
VKTIHHHRSSATQSGLAASSADGRNGKAKSGMTGLIKAAIFSQH